MTPSGVWRFSSGRPQDLFTTTSVPSSVPLPPQTGYGIIRCRLPLHVPRYLRTYGMNPHRLPVSGSHSSFTSNTHHGNDSSCSPVLVSEVFWSTPCNKESLGRTLGRTSSRSFLGLKILSYTKTRRRRGGGCTSGTFELV